MELLHMVMGRPPAPPPNWPPIHDHEVEAVADWIQSWRGDGQRRPLQSAKIAVLAVKLRLLKMDWPPRELIAGYLGVSIPLIDAFLGDWQDAGKIRDVRRRRAGTTRRYIVPSDEMIAVVLNAPRST